MRVEGSSSISNLAMKLARPSDLLDDLANASLSALDEFSMASDGAKVTAQKPEGRCGALPRRQAGRGGRRVDDVDAVDVLAAGLAAAGFEVGAGARVHHRHARHRLVVVLRGGHYALGSVVPRAVVLGAPVGSTLWVMR